MTRPVLLDLFCGAGGAARGYHAAGFDVVGVDHVDQPRYPFRFIRADATTFPLDGFDAVHASPPCQDHSAARMREHGTGWMLAATVDRVAASGLPWVVENVEGPTVTMAGWWVTLCGSSFGLAVRRHRRFGSNVLMLAPPCDHARQGTPLGVYGDGGGGSYPSHNGTKASRVEAPAAMGIDWMTHAELVQAVPPAYTEHLGRFLLDSVAGTEPSRVRPFEGSGRDR